MKNSDIFRMEIAIYLQRADKIVTPVHGTSGVIKAHTKEGHLIACEWRFWRKA